MSPKSLIARSRARLPPWSRRSRHRASRRSLRSNPMRLIIYYLVLSLVADFVSVMLCLGIEKFWPAGSVGIFIFLYFAILWGAWVVAVRMTEPKAQVEAPPGASVQPAE